jgi:hypothetical protein
MAAQAIAMQRMQQQREQEEEAQKRYKQQLGMQQQQLGLQQQRVDMAQAQEDRLKLADDIDQYLFNASTKFSDKTWEDLDTNAVLNALNEAAPGELKGKIRMSHISGFLDMYRIDSTGKYMGFLNPRDGKFYMKVQKKRGGKTYWRDIDPEDIAKHGIPGPIIEQADDNPVYAKGLARYLRQMAGKYNKNSDNYKSIMAFAKDFDTMADSMLNKLRGSKSDSLAFQKTKERVDLLQDQRTQELASIDDRVKAALMDEETAFEEKERIKHYYKWKINETRTQKRTKPVSRIAFEEALQLNPNLDVIDFNYNMSKMTPEARKMIDKAARENKKKRMMGLGGPTKKKREKRKPISKREAAAQTIRDTFGTPAPGLLKPTGQLTGPPMNLDQVKRMMEGNVR